MYQYFIFNGVNSLDMGVVMLKAPPIIKPQKRVSEITIPGRNGVLHEDEESFANYTKSAECHVMDRSRIDEVSAWLDGYGEVIFSSEPDKVYRTYIKNQISFNNILRNINDFLVQFDCYPLKYSVNKQDEEIILFQGTTVYNKGSISSEPVFTVYGTGNITLVLNEESFVLRAVDDFVTVNSELQEVYKENESKNSSFAADIFPVFKTGKNSISWTGNVEKIVIQPNWRWL